MQGERKNCTWEQSIVSVLLSHCEVYSNNPAHIPVCSLRVAISAKTGEGNGCLHPLCLYCHLTATKILKFQIRATVLISIECIYIENVSFFSICWSQIADLNVGDLQENDA